ncbi:MAG: glycosyltransferase family 2 protein [Isosphaeraceae bacterium]
MRIDLIEWGLPDDEAATEWPLGEKSTATISAAAASEAMAADRPGADYLLFWDKALGPPPIHSLSKIAEGGDVVHAGLSLGAGGQPPELDMIMADWSLFDPPDHVRCTSWRMSPRCCLVRVAMLRALGGLDPAFSSADGAFLEAGLRWQSAGAILWHDPSLLSNALAVPRTAPVVPLSDRYLLVLRHQKRVWARYVLTRRCLAGHPPWRERTAYRAALEAASARPAPAPAFWEWGERESPPEAPREEPRISVIIPTLGRYPYLPAALESIRRQTVRPVEVICVDQNPSAERRPEVYQPFDDLNVNVIWQDERGQSLARNTALAATTGDYIYMFDDDSVAAPDVIERHLELIRKYGADASTGVSYPPPPTDYSLPEGFRNPRVSQTFDTGNSLISRRALDVVGGLDRAYDRGVNTDVDFATRIYLGGMLIIHNPFASRVHYKAPIGGLRTYGAWWMNTASGWFGPFPAPTQVYYMNRFMTPRQRRERVILLSLNTMTRARSGPLGSRGSRRRSLAGMALFAAQWPLRFGRAWAAGRRLHRAGPIIPSPQSVADQTIPSRG